MYRSIYYSFVPGPCSSVLLQTDIVITLLYTCMSANLQSCQWFSHSVSSDLPGLLQL